MTRRPQILVVSTILHPDPVRRTSGAAQRLDMIMEALRELGSLDLLVFVQTAVDVSPAAVEREERRLSQRWQSDLTLTLAPYTQAPLRQPLRRLLPVLARSLLAGAFSWLGQNVGVKTSFPSQVKALERCLERQPDLVIAHKSSTLAPLLLTRRAVPPIVYEMDDLEYVKVLQRLRGGLSSGHSLGYLVLQVLSLPLLLWQNLRALRKATVTLVCSEADRQRLQSLSSGGAVKVVPNAQAQRPGLPLPESPSLLFLGTFLYAPNCQAVEHFVRHIWPLVRAARPDARLVVAGEEPQKIEVFAESPEAVEFTGYVEDLEALYARSRVVVVPLLEGSGTRVKIIEAALFQRPIVTSSIGVAGLDLSHGREVLIEDEPEAFAQACILLLSDDTRAGALAAAARATVLERYDRKGIVEDLRRRLRSTLAEAQLPPGSARRVVLVGGTEEPGGLQRHTAELADALSARGHDVSILAMHADHFSRFASVPLRLQRTALKERGHPLTLFYRWWRELAPFAGSSFIYCRGSGGGGSLSMLAALWLRGASLLTIEHRVPDPPGSGRSAGRRRLAAKLIQRSVSVSHAVRNAVITHCHLPPERAVTAANWVDHGRFSPDEGQGSALRAERGIAPDCLLLGYVGRLAPEKRVDLLLRGLARARAATPRPIALMLVGDGWMAEELREQAESLEITDLMAFLGEQQDPLPFYRAFDALVLPSLLEGMPLVILEAMASGTPCLMHDIAVAGEVIEDGRTGFIRHLSSTADMAAALCELAAMSPEALKARGAAARAKMVADHDPAARIAALVDALGLGETLEPK